jgi:putative sigma-54 modulation protein
VDVSIRSRNVELSESVRTAVQEKVTRLARFLDGMDHAEVLFSEERNPRISEKEVCEVTMSGHGHYVRARAAAPDALVAVDRVIDKLEHRMEKLKGKLISRSHPRRHGSVDFDKSRQLPDDDNSDVDELTIVKTKRFAIKPMTPEEAALQMELVGHAFYFFTNAETEQAAVVYRRNDGFVGLIEAG